ncbi:MAG: SAM-dependent DNA methyltransferase [Planctomycetes bacterium]|nr:SAM-dependent DNA methyltransferase [Planctomycetota bacterium]
MAMETWRAGRHSPDGYKERMESGSEDLKQIAKEMHNAAVSEETRADILGDLFQGGIAYGQRGQVFTPAPICDLMAQLSVGDEAGLGRRFCDPCCQVRQVPASVISSCFSH